MIKVTAVGLTGLPAVGKDTMADLLVREFDFRKVAFADPVYREIARAFEVPESLLRQRGGKEKAQPWLDLDFCHDREFAALVTKNTVLDQNCLSPRMALRWWGTEYRRAANPSYWIEQLEAWVRECRHDKIVVSDVRFENEAELVRSYSEPRVVHLSRAGVIADHLRHASDEPVLVHDTDTYLANDGDLLAFEDRVRHWARLHLP